METIVQKGGFIIYPLLLCAVLSLTIIIERAITLFRERVNKEQLTNQLKELLSRNKVMDALTLCEQRPTALNRVLKAGLLKHNKSREVIQETLEKAGRGEVPSLEKYLGILATIASISPLLGLLGTVSGMIKVFIEIENAGGLVDPSILAGGIWEALLTTAFGLSIAIPTLVAYNFFTSHGNRLISDMEEVSSELLTFISGEEKDEI